MTERLQLDTNDFTATISYIASKQFDTPTRYGHKYCVTIITNTGDRLRIYAFEEIPKVVYNGYLVPLREGDTIKGAYTERLKSDNETLKCIVWKTLQIVNDEVNPAKGLSEHSY